MRTQTPLVDQGLQRVPLGTLAVDVQPGVGHRTHHALERADRVVDALARREAIEHHDPALVTVGGRHDRRCRGDAVRHDDVDAVEPEPLPRIRALSLGEPQDRVEPLREVEPPRPQAVHRRIGGVGRLEVDGVQRVHEPDIGVVPSGEELTELARLAQHDHGSRRIRPAQSADDIVEPRAVERAEAVDDARRTPRAVVDDDGCRAHVPVRVTRDHRKSDRGPVGGIRHDAVLEGRVRLAGVGRGTQPLRRTAVGVGCLVEEVPHPPGVDDEVPAVEHGAVMGVLGRSPGVDREQERTATAVDAGRRHLPRTGEGGERVAAVQVGNEATRQDDVLGVREVRVDPGHAAASIRKTGKSGAISRSLSSGEDASTPSKKRPTSHAQAVR